MNNVIDIICRLLPNKVYVTIPKVQKDILYLVVGVCNLDTDEPMVTVKKNEPNAKATFNAKACFIESIIVKNSKYE